MTAVTTYAASGVATEEVLAELDRQLDARVCAATRLLFAFYGCGHDDGQLHDFLAARFGAAARLGGSSSGGVMTERGVHDARSIALLCIEDAHGDYGVAAAALGDDPAATAERLLLQALAEAGCTGQLPDLVWVYQAPGHEEQVLAGLRRVVGERCPILGGSSADDAVSGQWRQLGPQGPLKEGLVVAVLLPSTPLGHAFQGGYAPTGTSGVVTALAGPAHAEVGRDLLCIDGLPAAQVYRRWAAQAGVAIGHEGTLLAHSALCPLGLDMGQVGGVSEFLTVHPAAVLPSGALRTFCDVPLGARVHAMKGDRQQLVRRAGRVAQQALQALPGAAPRAAGALVIFCGGCQMAVGPAVAGVVDDVAAVLPGLPFVGVFTFGEQGPLLGRSQHGNLMVSALTWGA